MSFLRLPLTLRCIGFNSFDAVIQELIVLSVVVSQEQQSSAHAFLHVFICEHSCNSSATNSMKLTTSALPVFTNTSISPVVQILGDDRWSSGSHFVMHIWPFPINWHHLLMFSLFMTPSPCSSTSLQWISAGQMVFTSKNLITECTIQSVGLVIGWFFIKHCVTATDGKHWGCGRGPGDSPRSSETSSQ